MKMISVIKNRGKVLRKIKFVSKYFQRELVNELIDQCPNLWNVDVEFTKQTDVNKKMRFEEFQKMARIRVKDCARWTFYDKTDRTQARQVYTNFYPNGNGKIIYPCMYY